MSYSRILTALCVGLTLSACNDITGPLHDSDAEPAFRRAGDRSTTKTQDQTTTESATGEEGSTDSWSTLLPTLVIATTGDGATADGIDPQDVPDNTVEHASDAPALQTYATSFTHTAGKMTIFQLNYVSTSELPSPFLYLTIPADAQVLDEFGNVAPAGQQVTITVEVDLVKFLVHFGPHGSTFLGNHPAVLWLKYQYAETDGEDVNTLTMHYQPEAGEEWTQLDTEIDTFGRWARANIYHFSNYAVAW